MALQLPYIIWNAQHGFASFRFHLEDRHPANWLDSIKFSTLSDFVLVSVLLVSPFLVPVFIRILMAKPDTVFERTAKGLATWVFWISSGPFLIVSLFDEVWWWWNLLAYVLLLPLAAKYMGQRWLFYGNVVYGLLGQAFLLISSAVVPILVLFGGGDVTRAQLFGWEQLQAPMAALEAQYHPGFVASANPEVASVVGFSLDDPKVTALSDQNEYQYLFDRAAHRGETALIVLRDDVHRADLDANFDSIAPLMQIPVIRFGHSLGTFEIYLGTGYRAQP